MAIKWFKKQKSKKEVQEKEQKKDILIEEKESKDKNFNIDLNILGEKIEIEPVITEKSRDLINKYNTYAFKVRPVSLNKNFIKSFIENKFKVKILDIRTINYKRRLRGRTRIPNLRKSFKKVYVKLTKDQKIDIFD
jgi:large subunit ribosomal protein L23